MAKLDPSAVSVSTNNTIAAPAAEREQALAVEEKGRERAKKKE